MMPSSWTWQGVLNEVTALLAVDVVQGVVFLTLAFVFAAFLMSSIFDALGDDSERRNFKSKTTIYYSENEWYDRFRGDD